jgi:hypothetical protein
MNLFKNLQNHGYSINCYFNNFLMNSELNFICYYFNYYHKICLIFQYLKMNQNDYLFLIVWIYYFNLINFHEMNYNLNFLNYSVLSFLLNLGFIHKSKQ